MEPIFIILLGSIIASFIQGLCGFGFAVIAMSFWAWMLEPKMAATLTVFGALVGQTISVLTVRRGFNIQLLFPFLLGGAIGIPIGTKLLPMIEINSFKVILGIFLLTWCPIMLFAQQFPSINRKSKFLDAIIGIGGGIMSGLGGFAGVLPTLWCTVRIINKEEQRSVIQSFNFGALILTMSIYIYNGFVNISHVSIFLTMTPAVILPSLLGARLYAGISPIAFRRVILVLLTISGIALLSSSLLNLIGSVS